jgi:hypothetical protein
MKTAASTLTLSPAARGAGLVELMIALAAASLVLTFTMVMFITGQSNFAGLGNYAQLSNQSRLALDSMSRDIREATQIISWQTNATTAVLVFTNAYKGVQTTYSWTSTNSTLVCSQTGQPDRTYLAGCDAWSCSFFQRTPNNSWTFFPVTNLAQCKLINMSWKCSRAIIGQKLNTENMVTAQVVLRNKP